MVAIVAHRNPKVNYCGKTFVLIFKVFFYSTKLDKIYFCSSSSLFNPLYASILLPLIILSDFKMLGHIFKCYIVWWVCYYKVGFLSLHKCRYIFWRRSSSSQPASIAIQLSARIYAFSLITSQRI